MERKKNMNTKNREEFENILANIDENASAPVEEPMRQYYFIKKCRELVKAESESLGRQLTAVTKTFGCQMNAVTKIMKIA